MELASLLKLIFSGLGREAGGLDRYPADGDLRSAGLQNLGDACIWRAEIGHRRAGDWVFCLSYQLNLLWRKRLCPSRQIDWEAMNRCPDWSLTCPTGQGRASGSQKRTRPDGRVFAWQGRLCLPQAKGEGGEVLTAQDSSSVFYGERAARMDGAGV